MIEYISAEYRKLILSIKTLEYKVVFIFISVAVITFLSIVFASPNFYYQNFELNKFNSRIYWFLMDGGIMFLLPLICIKFFLKEKITDYGFTWGDKKFGFISTAIFLLFMVIVIWFASGSETFAKAYPQGGEIVKQNLSIFLFYELCIMIYMLGWEFLWRGYTLFGLKQKFGYYTIFIQMLPFFILHRGKPEIELFASIFAGLLLGIQALRSGSFLYSWILHWLVMLFIDGVSILRSKSGVYGVSPLDFINIFK